MNPAEESVLEHALGELLGARKSDLADRVLERLDAGEHGPAESRTDSSAPTVPHWTPRRRFGPSTAAAAVLVSVALGLALWVAASVRRNALEDVVATSVGRIGVLRPGATELVQARKFRSGETLVSGPEREERVRLRSGATLTLGRCAMVALVHDDGRLVPEARMGRATLRAAPSAELRARTELGTFIIQPGGSLQVDALVDGYDLEHPERFQELAKEVHMKIAIPVVATTAILLQGTAMLETASGRVPVRLDEEVREDPVSVSPTEVLEKLLEEVGTWDLTITNFDADGKPGAPLKGSEVCWAGPGDRWLLSEQTVNQDGRTLSVVTLVGYDPRRRQYTGSLADSFGGEIGLLKGTPDGDLAARELFMYSGQGTPGFDVRAEMRWETPDRRTTSLEALRDGEWVLVRKLVHERQE